MIRFGVGELLFHGISKEKSMKLYKGLIIIFVTICLTACQSTEFQFDLNELKNEIISAEIVYVSYDSSKDGKIDIVRTINQINLDQFLIDVNALKIIITHREPISQNGYGIRLNYANGYWLITEWDLEKHDEYIKLIKKPVGFDELIDKYVN